MNIIPPQDGIDIEIEDDVIVISQVTMGSVSDIRFHRVHLGTIIEALQQIENEHQEIDA